MRKNRYVKRKHNKQTGFMPVLRIFMLVSIGFAVSIGVFEAYSFISRSNFMPITAFELEGSVKYTDIKEIKGTLQTLPKMGFFNANVDMIKSRLEELKWVKDAKISRSWPDKIKIEIQEYQPIAIWNGTYFISPEGELVEISGQEEFVGDMEQLYGPEGDHTLVMDTYNRIEKVLRQNGLHLVRLKLNERRSIELFLDDDVLVIVGRDDVDIRVKRLVDYYAVLRKSAHGTLQTIDLRYTNGFSVSGKV
jgi:cell division protein FtsQ